MRSDFPTPVDQIRLSKLEDTLEIMDNEDRALAMDLCSRRDLEGLSELLRDYIDYEGNRWPQRMYFERRRR